MHVQEACETAVACKVDPMHVQQACETAESHVKWTQCMCKRPAKVQRSSNFLFEHGLGSALGKACQKYVELIRVPLHGSL